MRAIGGSFDSLTQDNMRNLKASIHEAPANSAVWNSIMPRPVPATGMPSSNLLIHYCHRGRTAVLRVSHRGTATFSSDSLYLVADT